MKKSQVSSIENQFSTGFSLIELVMSMGILAIIISVLMGVFGSIIDVSLESRSASGLDQDARFIVARLTYDMQRANRIITPINPSTIPENTLTIDIGSINYSYRLDGSGNLVLENNLGTNQLNSSTVEVSNLSFQRLGVGDETDTIQVKLNLTSKIKKQSGFESKSVQTTLSTGY